jgi:hypothetical protein
LDMDLDLALASENLMNCAQRDASYNSQFSCRT